jgi:hypothetical protein
MTNMTPYSNFSSYLRGLYRALDERDRLAKAGEDYTDLNHKLASLAGTLALGDPRLLPEENGFIHHLLNIEGFTFDDGCTLTRSELLRRC